MSKIEIIPPNRTIPRPRTEASALVVVPPVNPGGVVGSKATRWHADNQTRAFTALSERTRAEADLFDAQAKAVDSYIRRQQAGARLLELPEIIAADRYRRRAAREEEMRELNHECDLARMRRSAELARAETSLEDANQALRAQREHGFSAYEIEWQKRQCERLDIELSAEERREILREHRTAREGSRPEQVSSDEITNALLDARRQMRASGLNTTQIDTLLATRLK
ncbi:hypothetical protein [Bradyrhizobium sp. CCBAU 53338]|uniref:hypothetical protein n=1 Tax=Bradyrhizobium sp. CCBAU 53338 TaxID=1325111 RepID=UPI00188DBC74|nr:hypothetical protein [Bradyrhizobium sp. CCBAU 53338]